MQLALGWGAAEISAVSAATSVLVTTVLVVVTWKYVRITERLAREATVARQALIYREADEIMKESRQLRHEVMAFPPYEEGWTIEMEEKANQVSVALQRVAYLCEVGLLEREFVKEAWSGAFLRTWSVLQPWVRSYRVRTSQPMQRVHLERLAAWLIESDEAGAVESK